MGDGGLQITGGCFCGALRFEVSAAPVLVEFCHCETCRKATGAPMMAWAGVPCDGFEWTEGEPAGFASSAGVTRSFCGRCGTSLTHFSERFDTEIYVSLAALDDPEALPPEVHIWTSDSLTWCKAADSLPRYKRSHSEEV
jgi:hypothetical protein